jgi:hypothetical protein
MKSLLLLAIPAAALLSGCAAYVGDPYGYGYPPASYGGYPAAGYYGAYGAPVYGGYGYAEPSVSIGVFGSNRGGGGWRGRDGDGRRWDGNRDRDHDGVPDRAERRQRP